MIRKGKKKGAPARKHDKEKEGVFKALTSILSFYGYKVRREELKRGPGWTVSSGSCRKDEDRFVFVDRRSTIEDQLAFLVQTLLKSGINLTKDAIDQLPEDVRSTVASLLGIQSERIAEDHTSAAPASEPCAAE